MEGEKKKWSSSDVHTAVWHVRSITSIENIYEPCNFDTTPCCIVSTKHIKIADRPDLDELVQLVAEAINYL